MSGTLWVRGKLKGTLTMSGTLRIVDNSENPRDLELDFRKVPVSAEVETLMRDGEILSITFDLPVEGVE